MRTLITGGVRSGKSRHAETIVGTGPVRYVAPGYPPGDDAEWAARIAAHRARRPAHWETVETIDVAGILGAATDRDVLLVDCLTTWLTRQLDEAGAWTDAPGWTDRIDHETDRLGTLNQRIAAASERVFLVVVGRALDLSGAPTV